MITKIPHNLRIFISILIAFFIVRIISYSTDHMPRLMTQAELKTYVSSIISSLSSLKLTSSISNNNQQAGGGLPASTLPSPLVTNFNQPTEIQQPTISSVNYPSPTGTTVSPSAPTPTPLKSTTPTPTKEDCPTDQDIAKLLPNPLSPISANGLSSKSNILSKCLKNKETYYQVSCKTKVPWQLIAGIHYTEGGCDSSLSVDSGRPFGTKEPDLDSYYPKKCGPGIPKGTAGYIFIPPDGCGFENLYDSALFSAYEIMARAGNKPPDSLQNLVKTLVYFNTPDNANCPNTPYKYCPPLYFGEDHPYVFNWFDDRHSVMYVPHCSTCTNNTVHLAPGVLTVVRILLGK